jgi:hypothetical protein
MSCERILAAGLILVGATVASQTVVDQPQFSEEPAPPPPAYSSAHLIPIEMPPYVTIKVGIAPETVAVGADGVMRYVVVMRNASGSENAAHEGILCSTRSVKTYARLNSSGKWIGIEDPQWRDLTDNLGSRHAYAIAQQGGCDGRSSRKLEEILAALKRRSGQSY